MNKITFDENFVANSYIIRYCNLTNNPYEYKLAEMMTGQYEIIKEYDSYNIILLELMERIESRFGMNIRLRSNFYFYCWGNCVKIMIYD